jgi:hypothetical protein
MMMFRPIRPPCTLCTVQVTQVHLWLTRNILVVFIGFNPSIDTLNNKLRQSCENDIKHCDVNIIMPHHWKRVMFHRQSFGVGGIPQGMLMNMDFKSWRMWLSFWHFRV